MSQFFAVLWSFSFSISPSQEYSPLISFRMDWLDLLAVQGTLKRLFQQHSSKASILWRSAFLIVQLSHPYTTTGKTIALTRWTFVGKVTSLLFNKLSRLVITFLPRSKCHLGEQVQSPSAVMLEPKNIIPDLSKTFFNLNVALSEFIGLRQFENSFQGKISHTHTKIHHISRLVVHG